MSAAEETLPCLLCEERHPKEYFLYYIHTHFQYAQHSCANCNFKSVSADAMETHAAEKRHRAQLHSNRSDYMDRVCQIVLEDTKYAAVHGAGALSECSVKRPRGMGGNQNRNASGTSGQSAVRAVLNQQSAAAVRPAERKRLSVETTGMPSSSSKKSRPESPEPVLPDTTNEDVEIIEDPRPVIPRVSPLKQSQSTQNAGTTNGNAAQRRASIAEIVEKLDRIITRNQPEMECSKCGMKVPNNFLARQEHIRKRHLPEGSVSDDDAHGACFPDATAFTAKECEACGKSINSAHGRGSHAVLVHALHVDDHAFELPCPAEGCGYKGNSADSVYKHLSLIHQKKLHELTSDEKLRWKETRKPHEASIAPLVNKCFSAPYPDSSPDCGSANRMQNATNQQLATYGNGVPGQRDEVHQPNSARRPLPVHRPSTGVQNRAARNVSKAPVRQVRQRPHIVAQPRRSHLEEQVNHIVNSMDQEISTMNRQRTLSNGCGVDLTQRRSAAQQRGLKVEEDDIQIVRQNSQRHTVNGELPQSSSSRNPEQQRKWYDCATCISLNTRLLDPYFQQCTSNSRMFANITSTPLLLLRCQ